MDADSPFDIAIVGGGIIGLVLAVGLIKRHIRVKVYEQSRNFREIGAGVGIAINGIRCMQRIDPRVLDALKAVWNANIDGSGPPYYWLHWLDGYNEDENVDAESRVLFSLETGPEGQGGCHRAHFLDELTKLVPEGTVEFQKRLDTVHERGDDGRLCLRFTDGTTAEADAVIGCDGIKSRVRTLILGHDDPASSPSYAHKYAFRGLIPMDRAQEVLGDFVPRKPLLHMGPKAHIVHYPVANLSLMNVVAFVTDPHDWPATDKLTIPAKKKEAEKVFEKWGPTVRNIIDLLPEQLEKWALFDLKDHPPSTYARGCLCIAGDAAHGTTPHHAAGVGLGMEDVFALSMLLEMAVSAAGESRTVPSKALAAAFQTFSSVRKERCQWVVGSSRFVGDLYEWNGEIDGYDQEICVREATWRSYEIWDFSIDGMMQELSSRYQGLITDV